jgi:A/G-specific adenine glycosylase
MAIGASMLPTRPKAEAGVRPYRGRFTLAQSARRAYPPFVSRKPTYSLSSEPDDAKAEAVRRALISWFEENGRDLPWRRTRDPWRILVSEVMLQQIQVKRAITFYEAFLERFATPRALAEAPLTEALRVWGNLGRYRRVVNLHRTARILTEEFGGEVPSDPGVLTRLPGIGPYTAGAVACFAFEKDVAFLDTNVRRVLHRLFFGSEVPEPVAKEKQLLSTAETLVPSGRGWRWGQSVIDFGALHCTARKPLCESCPLSNLCAARPTIRTSLASLPRGGKATGRYEGSNRYYRGRALAMLREASEGGITLRELGEGLREGFSVEDLPWLRGVVESLEKDGLVWVSSADKDHPQGVAEEQAVYGADRPEGSLRATTRVCLP